MRTLLCLVLLLAFTSCKSIGRLFRHTPFQEIETAADRVNLWPLFYENGGRLAVLWPIFDQDEKGFALRPLVTKDGSVWEILPPICWFDVETGDWFGLPAYSFGEKFGVFPLFGTGWVNHVGPIWWDTTDDGEFDGAGIFPVVYVSPDMNYVGPVWWDGGDEGESAKFGIFPLFDVAEDWVNIGPVVWTKREDGDVGLVLALPLLGYGEGESGDGAWMTPLGGYGWNEAGETTMVNVLGPLFHYHEDRNSTAMAFAWPLVTISEGTYYSGFRVWPLFRRGEHRNEGGEVTDRVTTALLGLYRHAGRDDVDAVRMLPLFSYRNAKGGGERWFESLSLYGRKEYSDGATAVHIGTPMVFNYRGDDSGYRWSSLLGTVQYETREDTSEFNFLWYLYRQRTKGTETRRDFFPFFTWDSGEQRSGFSFLWRLFNWQRNGDKTSGHFLFIPWGER